MDHREQRDFALVVHACDRYALLYQGFHYFFQLYWDGQIPCDCYFLTEELEVQLSGFQNVRTGKGSFTRRLAKGLESIPHRYVVYMQEDMWLSEPVSLNFMNALFQFVREQQPALVKLHSTHVYKTRPTGTSIDGFVLARMDNEQSKYLMSHQVSLWDRETLLQQCAVDEDPWKNERRGTRRLRSLQTEIFQIDYFAENGNPAVNDNASHARAAYFTVSSLGMLNDFILPFLRLLAKDPKQEMYGRQLKKHYLNMLTHDGKKLPVRITPRRFLRFLLDKV